MRSTFGGAGRIGVLSLVAGLGVSVLTAGAAAAQADTAGGSAPVGLAEGRRG